MCVSSWNEARNPRARVINRNNVNKQKKRRAKSEHPISGS
jgi:hypothetical protein